MAIRDIIMAAAGATTGSSGPVYVEDVFATNQYTGTSASQKITNGIDLAGNGGMIWFKSRDKAQNHTVVDTVRGKGSLLATDGTYSATGSNTTMNSFDPDGFTMGSDAGGWQVVNTVANAGSMVAWTFRKAPKFFDVVSYTGTDASKTVPHSLGSVPGLVIIKGVTNGTSGFWWVAQHVADTTKVIQLNANGGGFGSSGYFEAHTSSYLSIYGDTQAVNRSGNTYIAYIFAHNAGGFGLTGTDSVSYCGSYTGNGSATGPTVTIGWEPQYLMVKRLDSTSDWNIIDSTRGMSTTDAVLKANTTATQSTSSDYVTQSSTGFQIVSSDAQFNASGGTYIYLAIRKAMKV